MSGNKSTPAGNTLLDALSCGEHCRFLMDCTPVVLESGEVLATSGNPMDHVYFPTRGYISLTVSADGNARLGIGLIGDEGMLGISLALGFDTSPLDATVLADTTALRMETGVFCHHLASSPGLVQVFNRYACVWISQLVRASSCNRFHPVEQRLARRLLMTQDRAHSDRFYVTQQVLAGVLGVRRPAVNEAASALQDRRLIRYSRGDMRIVDREGLEAIACSCYAAENAIYSCTMMQQ